MTATETADEPTLSGDVERGNGLLERIIHLALLTDRQQQYMYHLALLTDRQQKDMYQTVALSPQDARDIVTALAVHGLIVVATEGATQ